uniref:DUF1758 domain-containing protein n=1 Tax=Haemonchus contortus TaxID=6289 RepID=A0A7I4XS05_HAECO
MNDQTRQHQQGAKRIQEDSEDFLVGQARVWNVRTQEFEVVYIMLDTGANRSFIRNDFAKHLGLPKTGQLQLTIQTFGNSSAKNQSCEKTQIEIEDRHGTRQKFELAKIDFITGNLKRIPLSEEDRQYLQLPNITLAIPPQIHTLQTPILLGCGDLFTLFDRGFGSEHILPSKWDRYWSLESAGIEEHAGTQTEERRRSTTKSINNFELPCNAMMMVTMYAYHGRTT